MLREEVLREPSYGNSLPTFENSSPEFGSNIQKFLVSVPPKPVPHFGIFIGFYTVAGGIQAVIWTDVVQSIVLWLGGLFCLIAVVYRLPDGFGQVISTAAAADKFSLGSFDWDLGERTFWTIALLGIFSWLAHYTDQNFVQRYAASKSIREARTGVARRVDPGRYLRARRRYRRRRPVWHR